MNQAQDSVSLHPYFKIRPGQLDAVKALLPRFINKAATESGNLYYGFSLNGDELFCREAYVDADAALAHVQSVAPEIGELLTHADLIRLEVHGPSGELDKLRRPMADYNPAWFTWVVGVKR